MPAAASSPQEIRPALGTVIDGYRLERVVGVGGMGVVFEANRSGQRVAIKVLHPHMAEDREIVIRFLNEAKAAQIIGHPALVRVLSCGELSDGAPYMVMEYLEGDSLGSLLNQAGGHLSIADAVAVVRQTAEALAAAHDKDIIHRDLKPENVMLGTDQKGHLEVKVFDFGLAKMRPDQMADRGPDATVLKTQSGRLVGTPTYMAPEQCDEDGRPEKRTDVYALGVMLYECLAGRPPFVSKSEGNARTIEILSMHMMVPPPQIRQLCPEVPQDLAELVHAMLAKEQQKRPSMAQVAQKLTAMEKQNKGRRVPFFIWIVFLVMAVLLVLGGWLVIRKIG